MIERIVLKNFQAHRRLEVELDPQITVFVGSSDVGKSSVIRALRWLCFNRPNGDQFIKHGKSSVGVSIEIDGQIISRQKGKANTYHLNDQKYVAFGSGIPDPIAKLVNLNDLNFQLQHDPPFWFGLSPGQTAKELNRLVDLSLIDKALSTSGANVRRTKSQLDVGKQRLGQLRAGARALSWVHRLSAHLERLKEMRDNLETKREKQATLRQWIDKVEKYRTLSKSLSTSMPRRLEELKGRHQEAIRLKESLDSLVQEISYTHSKACRLKRELKPLRRKLDTNRCPVCGSVTTR